MRSAFEASDELVIPPPRTEGAGYCNRPVCYLTKSTILSSMLVGSVCEFVCVYVSLCRSHFESECHGTSPMDLLATRMEPSNFWHVKVKHPKKSYNSRTEEATNANLHHVIQEGDG